MCEMLETSLEVGGTSSDCIEELCTVWRSIHDSDEYLESRKWTKKTVCDCKLC